MRTIVGLHAKLFYVQIDPHRVGQGVLVEDKDRARRIKRGEDALGWGDRIHYDLTPIMSDGRPLQPGDPENDALLLDDKGHSIMAYRWTWDGEENSYPSGEQPSPVTLSSEYDDHGCTPVLRPNKDSEDQARHELTFQAFLPIKHPALPGGGDAPNQELLPSNVVTLYVD